MEILHPEAARRIKNHPQKIKDFAKSVQTELNKLDAVFYAWPWYSQETKPGIIMIIIDKQSNACPMPEIIEAALKSNKDILQTGPANFEIKKKKPTSKKEVEK